MSRSYKRFPGRSDNYGSSHLKFAKRAANKRVRRADNSYFDGESIRNVKRFYNPWDIRDYIWVYYNAQTLDKLFEQLKQNRQKWSIPCYKRYEDTDEELYMEAVRFHRK